MNKGRQLVGVFLILGMVLLISCTPKAAPAPQPPVAPAAMPAAAPAASAKPVWEIEWEKTLEAATKEGKVVMTTAGGAIWRNALTTGFKKAYGFTLEAITIRAVELYPKIFSERRAGIYAWDVFTAGAVAAVTQLKPAGVLDPLDPLLVLPDLTDPELIKQVWFGGKLGWVDRDHTTLMGLGFPESTLAINTNLVKEGEIKSYRDLLNPKWKGKLIFSDPTVGGFPGSTFMPMIVLGGVAGGVEWLREIVKNEPIVMRDERLMLDWLAHGKVAIVIAPKPDTVVEFMRAGAPVKTMTPREGTAISGTFGGVTAISRRPHPNATKVFINWFLSKEGQIIASQALGGQSLRNDVPTDFLPPERIRQPGANYYIKETEENLLKQDDVVKIAKEIFGPLIK